MHQTLPTTNTNNVTYSQVNPKGEVSIQFVYLFLVGVAEIHINVLMCTQVRGRFSVIWGECRKITGHVLAISTILFLIFTPF